MGARYTVRFAKTESDIQASQELRSRVFRDGSGLDQDGFDAVCEHILVEHAETGDMVCTFRLLLLESGQEISSSYSAQVYDLSCLSDYKGKMVEVGRFCVDPDYVDPDILRLAWTTLTEFVDANDIELLFGCSSFPLAQPAKYADTFALLTERYLAPKRWSPRTKAPQIFKFTKTGPLAKSKLANALKGLPPLLRTYLTMGGWVSDHAVIDDDLNTLHVFTGLEVKRISASRKRFLRASVA